MKVYLRFDKKIEESYFLKFKPLTSYLTSLT